MTRPTAFIFCIGRDLLEGLVLDKNANFLANRLTDAGCRVRSIQVVDLIEAEMMEAFESASRHTPTYVFTTGGLGPAHDDITRQCVAKLAKVGLKLDDNALEMVARAYRRLHAKGAVESAELTDARRRLATVPQGAICHENPIGTAPAVQLAVKSTTWFLFPGVPEEMHRIFNLSIAPLVKSARGPLVRKSRHVDYPSSDESALSGATADLARRHPTLHIKTRAHTSGEAAGLRITVTGEHADENALDDLLARAESELRAQIGGQVRRDAARPTGQ